MLFTRANLATRVYITRLLLLTLLLFVVGFAFRYQFSGVNPSFLDFGFEANTARRVSLGQFPYRDFFTLINPLHFFMTGYFLELFGDSTRTLFIYANIIGSAINVLIFVIFFRISRSIYAGLTAWVASVIVGQNIVGVVPNYSLSATLFFIVTLLLYIELFGKKVRNKTKSEIMLSFLVGVGAALTLLTKQTMGVYLILAVILSTILFYREKVTYTKVMWFTIGFSMVVLIFMIMLFNQNAQHLWFDDTVGMIKSFSREAKIAPPFLFSGVQSFWIKLVYNISLIFSVLISTYIISVIYRKDKVNVKTLTIGVFAVSLFLVTNERFSQLKLIVGIQLLVPFMVTIIFFYRNKIFWLLAFSAVVPILIVAANQSSQILRSKKFLVKYESTRASFYTTALNKENAEAVTAYLKDGFDDRTVILVAYPIYYYLAGVSNPTRFDLAIPANLTEDDKKQLNNYLIDEASNVIFEDFNFDGRLSNDYLPKIHDTLSTDFCRTQDLGSMVLLTKKKELNISKCVKL